MVRMVLSGSYCTHYNCSWLCSTTTATRMVSNGTAWITYCSYWSTGAPTQTCQIGPCGPLHYLKPVRWDHTVTNNDPARPWAPLENDLETWLSLKKIPILKKVLRNKPLSMLVTVIKIIFKYGACRNSITLPYYKTYIKQCKIEKADAHWRGSMALTRTRTYMHTWEVFTVFQVEHYIRM